MTRLGWLVVLFALAAPGAGLGQVIDRSDEELRSDGWEFDEERATPGNVGASLLALTVGTVWHGVGHGFVGDRPTSNRLFASEGIALVAAGAGLAIRRIADTSPTGRAVGTTLQVGAGGLFAAGWLADIVGSSKGTGDTLPRETSELPGLTAEAYFTTLVERGVGIDSLFVLRLPFVGERWVLRPIGEVGVDLEYWRAGLGGGWRLPFGDAGGSWFELGATGYEENAGASGYGRTQLAGTTAVRVDLGDVFPHLTGLMWTNRLDVAVDHHFYEVEGNDHFRASGRAVHVPVETGFGLNVNRGVHIGFGYRHRRDLLVGMAGRHVGSFWGRLGVLPREGIGVDLQLEQGAFTRAWVGLQWTLARPGRRGETAAN